MRLGGFTGAGGGVTWWENLICSDAVHRPDADFPGDCWRHHCRVYVNHVTARGRYGVGGAPRVATSGAGGGVSGSAGTRGRHGDAGARLVQQEGRVAEATGRALVQEDGLPLKNHKKWNELGQKSLFLSEIPGPLTSSCLSKSVISDSGMEPHQ